MNIIIDDIRIDYILSLDGKHCKIISVNHSKTAKYGIRKFYIEGLDLITHETYQLVVSGPSHGSFCSERIKLL